MNPCTTTGTASARVAANVRAELAARRMRYDEFGRLVGWSKSTVSRRLAGGTWPVDDVEAAAAALGVSEADLTRERAA